MKVFAPGKLILSGEHAVVYGQPALAMAINRYVIASAQPHFLPGVFFNLSDLSYRRRLSLSALQNLKSRIKRKYQSFISGDFKIRDVLQKPFELAQVALILFFEMLNIKLTQGIQIELQSDIPIGCGMGSSAATILSIVHAIAHHLEMEIPEEVLFRLSLEAENLQHGFSSGLDLRISQQGGCVFIHNNVIETRPVPQIKFYLINTGAPQTSTGECVAAAADHFKNSNIGNDFAAITKSFDAALQRSHFQNAVDAVKQNHVLLTHIGVVPKRVQQFVADIEKEQGAAKICGAGAVSGENAGVVLVLAENETALNEICSRYQYTILPVTGEPRGVHVI